MKLYGNTEKFPRCFRNSNIRQTGIAKAMENLDNTMNKLAQIYIL